MDDFILEISKKSLWYKFITHFGRADSWEMHNLNTCSLIRLVLKGIISLLLGSLIILLVGAYLFYAIGDLIAYFLVVMKNGWFMPHDVIVVTLAVGGSTLVAWIIFAVAEVITDAEYVKRYGRVLGEKSMLYQLYESFNNKYCKPVKFKD